MWKIVVVLLLTALAIGAVRLAFQAPQIHAGLGALSLNSATQITPPLMYAGVRG